MSLLRRRQPKYTQVELHQQVEDITTLQAQREEAMNNGNEEELKLAERLIEGAQKVLERMYE